MSRRQGQWQVKLAAQTPVAVRKMSPDEGEKFYFEYWEFDNWGIPATTPGTRGREKTEDDLIKRDWFPTNSSLWSPPSRPLIEQQSQQLLGRSFGRAGLQRRNFECPSGTSSCSSIDRPDSCCNSGDVCVIVPDDGLGDVGCCPQGGGCSGGVSFCDTSAGYSSCPGSPNGGCCIPNFECLDIGCECGRSLTNPTFSLLLTGPFQQAFLAIPSSWSLRSPQ